MPVDRDGFGSPKGGHFTPKGWNLGVRARLLLAFFGISAFAVLAAGAGIYAFRQVGERIELIDARVPQVVSSMEISRAADRLIASAPALLAATTTKEHDEVSSRMRPEVDRLIIGLNEVVALRHRRRGGRHDPVAGRLPAIQSGRAREPGGAAAQDQGAPRRTAAGGVPGQSGDAAAVCAMVPGHGHADQPLARRERASAMPKPGAQERGAISRH